MSKSLRRVLDRLLGQFRKPTATREGVQEPQQMQALVPAFARSRQS
jgi:hypothetical protein